MFTKRKVIALIMLLFILVGCSKKSEKDPKLQKQSQEEEESQEAPEQLKEIESELEKIIQNLNGPAAATEEERKQQESNAGGSSSGSTSQGGGKESSNNQKDSTENKEEEGEKSTTSKEGQQQESTSEQKEGQQDQTSQKPKEDNPWQKVTPIINKMHYTWNAFMPMAVKQGAEKVLVDKFSTSLNSLTDTIIGKNMTNTLFAASYLYSYIPDFYSLYRTGTSSEIKRIRYYTRNAMLNSTTANWEQVDSDVKNLKGTWAIFKTTLSKEQQMDSNKLEFSIYEMENVVKERNQSLTDIKGRVTMSNIDILEEASEKSSKQSSGGSSGQSSEED